MNHVPTKLSASSSSQACKRIPLMAAEATDGHSVRGHPQPILGFPGALQCPSSGD